MRHGGPISLGLVLALAIGGIVLVAASTSTLLGWLTARRLTTSILEQRAEQSMATLSTSIDSHLRPVRDQVEGLGRLMAEGRLDLTNPEVAGPLFLAGLATRPELNVLGFIDPEFGRFSALRQNDGTITVSEGSLAGDPAAVRRFQSLQPPNEAQWGDAFYVPNLADAVVNIAMAVERDGKLLGYVIAGITTRSLTATVDTLGKQYGVTVFVLYGQTGVLAHPGLLAAGGLGSSRVPLARLDEVGDPVLARLWQGTPLRSSPLATDGIVVTEIPGDGSDSYIVLHKSIDGYGDRPWIIGVEVPEHEIESTTRDLRRLAFAAIGLPLLGLLSALLLARLIARPIHRLTRGVQQVAELEIAKVPQLPPSRVRELDQQVTAFNAMLRTLRAFETYVPKSLVRRLIGSAGEDRGNGQGAAVAGQAVTSRQRDLTVMFTDIVGFTSLSELLSPREVAELLNHHFAMIASCVEAEGGTVDKYLGDGMMAFWGAPERIADRAARACRAALAIRCALTNDNLQREQAGQAPVRMRIGIHRGPLLVGNIGAPDRVNYTVVGDAANVAQRLEELGRQWSAQDDIVILVSDAVVEDIGAGFTLAPAGVVTVKGRNEPISTWRLVGPSVAAQG